MSIEPVSDVDIEETLMECSEPGAIRDEEFVAYLEGEKVRPALEEHLERCQSCSSRLVQYRRMEGQLTNKLYRWDCPSNQLLGEYQLGLLSNDMVTAIQTHLGMCVLCCAELATLNDFLAMDAWVMERVPVASMQDGVQSTARATYHPVPEAGQTLEHVREQVRAGARRIAAWLVPPAPGFSYQRGSAQPGADWPRDYRAEDVSISLQLESSLKRRDSMQLIGLVSRQGQGIATLQGILVQLMNGKEIVQSQHIDELGNVIFADLLPASYSLELHLPEGIIIIEPLSIQPPASS
ncbi:hypothetical protein [Dictyobacter arantiisoli]|uniref:Zinc-finger domain-containing protein n=1 Tax=Dictyobacter arantiisoli TaxID=2014874 RepID=A0A5A5TDU4_9CHLR|nr:hypothetical protein [Dictyobacter arantiisoli]GCF09395.1 hypothetical protein KDI_29590 [Dictyobacter arantiisoli]